MMLKKILVVDDEPDFCEALGDFLGAKGYSVLEAHDGDQALEAYRQERPDVVLLDVNMPGKNGIETLKELRTFDPEASVIMVTAIYDEDISRLAMAEGAFDYITKPIDHEYLELALMTKLALLGSGD